MMDIDSLGRDKTFECVKSEQTLENEPKDTSERLPQTGQPKESKVYCKKTTYLILTLVIILVISIMLALLLISQIPYNPRFQLMSYPPWAPNGLTMTLIGLFTFLFSMLGFIFLSGTEKNRRFIPFILGLMIAEVISIVLFLFLTYATGAMLVSVFILLIAVLVELYIVIYLGFRSVVAMVFQLPYFIFLVFLMIVVIFMATTNKV